MLTLQILPELQALIPPLSTQEHAQLETNLLAEGCRDVLLLGRLTYTTLPCPACGEEQAVQADKGQWSCAICASVLLPDTSFLLDGHTRYALCRQHGLPFAVETINLPSLDAAKDWMLQHQLGRRNLTPEQMSYLRGKQYEVTKQTQGINNQYVQAKSEKAQSGPFHDSTAEHLAQEHKVSRNTIKRDAAFSRDVDAVADVVGPEARTAMLARDTKIGRQEVKQLSNIATASPQAAKHVVDEIQTAKTPKMAKQVIRDAAKQYPRAPVARLAVSALALLPEEPPRIGLEALPTADGKILYVLHKSDSKSVFNKTNEMVDWASWTWNPVTGCWHGCDYCYAREIANNARMADAYPKQFEPTFHPARLDAPANTAVPQSITRPADRNVFTCSMADLFGKWVPDAWILAVFERVRLHPEWNFLFLTKFPQRLQQVCEMLGGFPTNAWVGCTVDAQARVTTAERAFQGIKASVRWLSVEPLRERLTFNALDIFDWIVIGGQTVSYFNNTPAFQPEWEWVEHLWHQARAAGVKVYWKENLTVRPKEVPWSATLGDEEPAP